MLKRPKSRAHLFLFAGSMTLLFIGITAVRLFDLSHSLETYNTGMDSFRLINDGLDNANEARNQIGEQVKEFKSILLRSRFETDYQKRLDKFAQAENGVREQLSKTREILKQAEINTDAIDRTIKDHGEMTMSYLAALKNYNPAKADHRTSVDNLVADVDQQVIVDLNSLIEQIKERITEDYAALKDHRQSDHSALRTIFVALLILELILSGTSGLWMIRSVARSFDKALQAANRLTESDLTVGMEGDSIDEVGQPSHAIRKMVSRRIRNITEMTSGVDSPLLTLKEAATLSHLSQHLPRRPGEPTPTARETSSSLAQMNEATSQNADHSAQTEPVALLEAAWPADHDERIATETNPCLASTLDSSYQPILRALMVVLEARNIETRGHSERVVTYSVRLAHELGLDEADMQAIELGALLHDIGKIGIEDKILLKPEQLTGPEWIEMRKHTEKGAQIIEGIPMLRAALPIITQHHERWDGTGYPAGLTAELIDIKARIFTVADALDAITSDRPYDPARCFAAARDELVMGAGKQFDPKVVEAFCRVPLDEWASLGKQLGA
jgi:putative nucleotidyltransferase with HDIG domain